MAVHDWRNRPRSRALATRLAILGAAALCVVGFLRLRIPDSQRLLDLLLEERFTAGQLAGGAAWRACTVREDSAAFVPRMECGASPDLDRIDRALRRLSDDSSPQALRGRGLVELLVGADVPRRRQDAIQMLQAAADAAPENAGLLNDLAVAYLLVGEREQRLEPMIRALENVERAFARDSTERSILFNRALIYERLYLIHGAEQAWLRYLAVARDRRWRAEAERHLRDVRRVPETISWDTLLAGGRPPRLDALSREAVRYQAARSPQIAREFGFPLLGEWGNAYLSDDSVRAERLLAIAREIGGALTADRSVALAVAAIDSAAGDPQRLHALANGHIALAAAFRLTEKGEYSEAEDASERADQSLTSGRSPAARWAAFYDASSEVNLRKYDHADQHLSSLQFETGSNEPALKGKVIWALGLSQMRRARPEIAAGYYRMAAPEITRSNEVENEGAVALLLAESLYRSGQRSAADTAAYRALRLLSPYRRSKFFGHLLHIICESRGGSGLHHASIAMANEAIAVGIARNSPNLLTLFYGARANDYAALQNWPAAEADLVRLGQWARALPGSSERVAAHAQLAIGQINRLRDPWTALPRLQAAVEAYAPSRDELYLPRALYEAAMAARAVGNVAQARAWLGQGVEHVERQRATFGSQEDRAAFYGTVENLFDARIALEVTAGDTAAAFAALERGRIPLWDADEHAAELGLADVQAALPPRTLLVEYALLADSLVIWAVSRNEVRQHVVLVPRREIAQLAEQFERYETTEELRNRNAASARLFNLLVLPLTPHLDAFDQVTVVPDRELYDVPFAALWNPVSGKFLIESHTLRAVPAAAFYLAVARHDNRLPRNPGALVVGDPALDRTLVVGLPPLGGAAREAESVAAQYRGAVPLTGAEARRDRVRARLTEHPVFHFAGHAVFNPDQPEESYLALGADGSESRGRMRAREIGELRLSNLQVVVLSACSTLGQRATRTGPAAGLAYSFLRAGAPATVSTLWDVPDAAPTSLLVDFHGHLAAGTPAAEALRQAQVKAIEEGRMTPRAWAAFVYTGP